MKIIHSDAHLNRPMRNITARSNSETTLKQTNSEIGIETIINKIENNIAMISMQLDKLPSAVKVKASQ